MNNCVLVICNCGFEDITFDDITVEFEGKLNDDREFADGSGSIDSDNAKVFSGVAWGKKFTIYTGGGLMASCTDVFGTETAYLSLKNQISF